MTESHSRDSGEPGLVSDSAPERRFDAAGPVVGRESGETAGLVVVINAVLGGLGSLYLTTKSTVITITSAVLVVLLVVFAKRRSGRAFRPGRRGDRSGW